MLLAAPAAMRPLLSPFERWRPSPNARQLPGLGLGLALGLGLGRLPERPRWDAAGTLLGRCWDTAGTLLGDSGTRSETLGTKMMVFQWFYKHSWRLTRRRPFEKKDPLGFHTQRTLRTQHAEAVH